MTKFTFCNIKQYQTDICYCFRIYPNAIYISYSRIENPTVIRNAKLGNTSGLYLQEKGVVDFCIKVGDWRNTIC